ncbi:tail assembly protein [Haemophilus parainfluenzae]|nr:tail assembly protein [Haemophilus parainfluenzae]DAX21160.1 MAG TPA: tail assembly protein [Caudoviricetes sp.]
MAKITFHGNLKRFSDEPFELDVSNFRELMSGLLTQIKGLRQHLRHGYYKVRVGSKYLSEEQLKANPIIDLKDDCTVHFTPVVAGAGKAGGIIQAVLGVVLIVVGAWTANYGLIAAGAGMLIGGAVTLLTKMPDMNNKHDEGEKKQSTSFSNLRNLTPQGRPIPLLYGKMMTSLVLVSQGIETFDDV